MHEYSIARDILNRALNEAARQNAAKVSALRIRIGPQDHLNKDALMFGIEATSKGTIADGAQIHMTDSQDEGIVLDSIEIVEVT